MFFLPFLPGMDRIDQRPIKAAWMTLFGVLAVGAGALSGFMVWAALTVPATSLGTTGLWVVAGLLGFASFLGLASFVGLALRK